MSNVVHVRSQPTPVTTIHKPAELLGIDCISRLEIQSETLESVQALLTVAF